MATIPVDSRIDSKTAEFFSRQHRMLIDGRFVLAASGKTFPVYNPATGEVVARVPEAEAEDVNRAVSAARRAFDEGPWSKMSTSQRGQLIWKVADLLEANLEEFAEIESLDNGKPFSVARVADLPLAVDMFRYMAGWATKISGSTLNFSPPAPSTPTPCVSPSVSSARSFPGISPADGSVEACPGACRRLLRGAQGRRANADVGSPPGRAVRSGRIPPGVVNILTGYGEGAGAPLAAHPLVDKMAFTGSTEVGKLIVKASAGNLKKVSLELGGKSPAIIFPDADLERAIRARPAPSSSTRDNAAAPAHGSSCTKASMTRFCKG
jgi:phenylacetaldehyde dehydrogenase